MKKKMVNIRNRAMAMALACLFLCALVLVNCAKDASFYNSTVLARVEVPGYLEDLNLPVYADLEDGNEVYYALVIATRSQLAQSGATYRIIDEYREGVIYLIATEDVEGAREEAARSVKVLYDDGEHIIVRYEPGLSETLPDMGFDLKLMSRTTINFTADEVMAKAFAAAALSKDKTVEAMIKSVNEDDLKTAMKSLSGESSVVVDNADYTFKTRDTESGTPVQKATQYIYDRLNAMGLKPAFQNWESTYYDESLKNRNVVGEITGQETPSEVIVLIAHLDSITKDPAGLAPGVDDNASGCVGLLTAADIMRAHRFKRTIRFIFTTGEEQGLYGGIWAADEARKQNQNIVAVINLDMIAYTHEAKPRMQVKTRNYKNRGGYTLDKTVADTCLEVVAAYGLDSGMTAVFEDDGEVSSDHSPFWDKKYPAVWLIEYAEEGYLNPHMHSADDTVKQINMSFFASIVKTSIGTVAHLAGVVD